MIIFSVFIDPIRLTFSEIDYEFYLYIDCIFDICFMTDIIFNFFIPYSEKGVLEKKSKKICLNYLARWFIFDLVSSIPFSLIILILNSTEGNSNLLSLKNILRISRIYRMFKWATVFRLLKFAKYKSNKRADESDLEEDTAVLRIVKFLFFFIILIHISSCLWIYIGLPTENENFTWIYYNYLSDSTPGEVYLASMYFNLVTMYTIGYGDIRPYTFWERFYNCIFMSIAIVLYSFSVTSLSTIFQRYNMLKAKLNYKLEYVKDLFIKYNLSKELHRKIKVAIRHNLGKVVVEKFDLLDSLPESLKKRIFVYMYKSGLSELNFFLKQEQEFIFYVLPMLKSQVWTRGEIVISHGGFIEEMYIVGNGTLSVKLEKYGNVQISLIKKNQHFGDILIYYNENSKYKIDCFTSKCELLTISKFDFSQIKLTFEAGIENILIKSYFYYFYQLEKSKQVIEKLFNMGIKIEQIKYKLKRLNNFLMERNFDDIFLNDLYYMEAEDFILMYPEQQIIEFMKTSMTERDFIKIFGVENLPGSPDFNKLEKAQTINEYSKNGSLLSEIIERSESEESYDKYLLQEGNNNKKAIKEKILDNINKGNFSNQIGTYLSKNDNTNANISICTNFKNRYTQLFDDSKNVAKDILYSHNNKSQNKTKDKYNRRNSKISNKTNNKIDKNENNIDPLSIIKEKIKTGLIQGSATEDKGKVPKAIRRKSINIFNREIIQITEESKNSVQKTKTNKTNKELENYCTEEHKNSNTNESNKKISSFSSMKKEENFKNHKNINSNQDQNETIKFYKIKKKMNSKSSVLNSEDINNIYNTNLISDERPLIYSNRDKNENIDLDNSYVSNSKKTNKKKNSDKEKSNNSQINAQSSEKNPNYNILQIYNYGNNIKNEYVFKNNNEDVDVEKENNPIEKTKLKKRKCKNKSKSKSKGADKKFPKNSLVCFKTHSIQYTNFKLIINQINQNLDATVDVLDIEKEINKESSQLNNQQEANLKEKNEIVNFNNDNNVLTFAATETIDIKENKLTRSNIDYSLADKINKDTQIIHNESIDMEKLNLFTDENFLFISQKSSQENYLEYSNKIKANDNQNISKIPIDNNVIQISKDNSNNLKPEIELNLNYLSENEKKSSHDVMQKYCFSENNISNSVCDKYLKTENNDIHRSKFNCSTYSSNDPRGILIKKNIPIVYRYDLILSSSFNSCKSVSKLINEQDYIVPSLIENQISKSELNQADNKNSPIIPNKILIESEKEKNSVHRPFRNTIIEERAILKLDYIYSILKVIDKYQE